MPRCGKYDFGIFSPRSRTFGSELGKRMENPPLPYKPPMCRVPKFSSGSSGVAWQQGLV